MRIRWGRDLCRTLALLPIPVLFGGCLAIVGLGVCVDVCNNPSEEDAPLQVTINQPGDNAQVGPDPFTVSFYLDGNETGAIVTVSVGGTINMTTLGPLGNNGDIVVTPAFDSGSYELEFEAHDVEDPSELTEATLTIEWTAPWETALLRCAGAACGPLEVGTVLSGTVELLADPTWDDARLTSTTATVRGTDVTDTDQDPSRVTFDTTAFSNGVAIVSITAIRDDGARATATVSVSISN